MHLPNFLIIGAAKSGTTSLWAYLRQHPDVFFSPYKEPNYFALAGTALPRPGPAPAEILHALLHTHSVTDYARYLSLFEAVQGQRAIGEASVRYLYFEEAPQRIKETIPDVRLVAILREPVSRLYSHYCMNVQFQLEPLTLRDAIEAESARRAANWGWDWHYTQVGRYAQQLRRYLSLFGREQLKIFLYDDFVARPLDVFREVCRHIGVDDTFVPDMSERGKVAYRPQNLTLDRWLHWPNPTRTRLVRHLPRPLTRTVFSTLEHWNQAPIPRLDSQTRKDLSAYFRDDFGQLEELLGRRIPWGTTS